MDEVAEWQPAKHDAIRVGAVLVSLPGGDSGPNSSLAWAAAVALEGHSLVAAVRRGAPGARQLARRFRAEAGHDHRR